MLNQTKLLKVLKGAGIAAAGAALTYLEEHLAGVDFGQVTPVAVALNSVATNALRKWVSTKDE